MFPNVEGVGGVKGKLVTLKHIWWPCVKLQDFWRKLYNEINLISLKFTPECCLLHLYLCKKDCIFVSNLLIVTKVLIAQKVEV